MTFFDRFFISSLKVCYKLIIFKNHYDLWCDHKTKILAQQLNMPVGY